MYEIRVRANFSAAHNLKDYHGKCEHLHGHNWLVEAVFAYRTLDKSGLAIDFRIAKAALKNITESLDHSYLNKLKFLGGKNPTSENIAKFVFDRLKKKIKTLKSVSVWENEGSSATYLEDEID